MKKYEYYVWCEFDYLNQEGEWETMLYTGKQKNFTGDAECHHCGKHLKGKVAHTFTEEEDGVELVFGSECVKRVFGPGLVKSC